MPCPYDVPRIKKTFRRFSASKYSTNLEKNTTHFNRSFILSFFVNLYISKLNCILKVNFFQLFFIYFIYIDIDLYLES